VASNLRSPGLKKQAGVEGEFSSTTEQDQEGAGHRVVKSDGVLGHLGLKACVLDKEGLKGKSTEEVVYRLYYELAMTRMEHRLRQVVLVLDHWPSSSTPTPAGAADDRRLIATPDASCRE